MIREYLNKQGATKIIDAVKNSEDNIKLLDGRVTTLENTEIDTDRAKSVTHAELVSLRDNNSLVPGMFYRITNYDCKINGDTSTNGVAGYHSARHPFDIVLLALSENKLAERGWATHHEGDTYFANCNLAAWQVWYCLDNDTDRFSWATPISTSVPDGVIYRLIDEHNNDCCYDFKNIVFEFGQDSSGYPTYIIGNTSNYTYTFNYYEAGATNPNKDATVSQFDGQRFICVCNNTISYSNPNAHSSNFSGSPLPRISFFVTANTSQKFICENNKIDTYLASSNGVASAVMHLIAGGNNTNNIVMGNNPWVELHYMCQDNIIYSPIEPPTSNTNLQRILNESCINNVIGPGCGAVELTRANSCEVTNSENVALIGVATAVLHNCQMNGCEYTTLQADSSLTGGTNAIYIQNVRVDNVKGTVANPITINHMTANDNFITTYTSANNQTIVI